MFVGTLPYEVLCVLHKCIAGKKKDIFVGCSGNYTFDKQAASLGLAVHSNDVALYSRLIADILLGIEEKRFSVKNEELESVFASWPPHRFKDFISVLFSIKISQFAKRKNDYQRAMWNNYMDSSLQYYRGTIEKFEKYSTFEFKIADFFYGDFVEFIKAKQGKGIGLMFPPTYKGGYEKMYQFIEDTFEYEPAQYQVFDPDSANLLFQQFLETDENVIFTDQPHENMDRLSKLVLYLLLSKEIQQILSRKYFHYFQGIYTTVYTDKPVSMKYRGVFNLMRRDKKKGALMYSQNFTTNTITENFQKWIKATSKK